MINHLHGNPSRFSFVPLHSGCSRRLENPIRKKKKSLNAPKIGLRDRSLLKETTTLKAYRHENNLSPIRRDPP